MLFAGPGLKWTGLELSVRVLIRVDPLDFGRVLAVANCTGSGMLSSNVPSLCMVIV